MRNARFWVWYNGGWVKLTLKPNELLHHWRGGPSEEGWWSHEESWAHLGDVVLNQWDEDGADCDGRYARGGSRFCPLDQLAAIDMMEPAGGWEDDTPPEENRDIHVPDWQYGNKWQRDYAAEAAGY